MTNNMNAITAGKQKGTQGLIGLVKRNIKLYFRLPSNIVWSLITVLILFTLHFIVFRNMTVDGMMSGLYANDFAVDRVYLTWLADSLMFAAVIPLTAVSISLITLAQIIEDKERNIYSDLLVSPLGKKRIMASYLVSSFLISTILIVILVLFCWIFLFATSGISFSFVQFLLILASSFGAIIFGNIMMLLIISFLKNEKSVGAIGTIIGTALGFLGGAYVPIGVLGNTMGSIFGVFPFLQMTVLSRQAFIYRMEAVSPLRNYMIDGRFNGFELYIGNTQIPVWGVILMLSGITLLLLTGLIIRFALQKKRG